MAYRQPDWALRNRINEAYFPFRKIIDAPSFQLKTEASLLQIADMCAYVVSRQARGLQHAEDHFAKIEDNLIILKKDGIEAAH